MSFRPAFEALMQARNLDVVVHEATFETFRWDGAGIALGVIDGPKKPAQLRDALLALAPGLDAGSRLLIKNANNPRYFAVMAYLQALAAQGALALQEADADGHCNSAAWLVRLPAKDLAAVIEEAPLEVPAQLRCLDGALGQLGTFQLALLHALVVQNAWGEAYQVIDRMQGNRRILKAWDRMELDLARSDADPEQLGWLAEIMSLQHAKGGLPPAPKSFKASAAMTRRAFLDQQPRQTVARAGVPARNSRARASVRLYQLGQCHPGPCARPRDPRCRMRPGSAWVRLSGRRGPRAIWALIRSSISTAIG